jgi:hypothetical protein
VRPFAEVGTECLAVVVAVGAAHRHGADIPRPGPRINVDMLPGKNAVDSRASCAACLGQAVGSWVQGWPGGVPAAVVDEHVEVRLPAGATDTVNDEPAKS